MKTIAAEKRYDRSRWRHVSAVGLLLTALAGAAWAWTHTREAAAAASESAYNQPGATATVVAPPGKERPGGAGGSPLQGILPGLGDPPSWLGDGKPAASEGGAASMSGPSSTCSPDWAVVTTPNYPFQGSLLNAVAEVGPGDVWAGGTYGVDASPSHNGPFFEHWDGTSWSTVAVSLPFGADSGQIQDIAVSSGSDIWAVGAYTVGTNTFELIYNWDGTQWNLVAGAKPSPIANALSGVTVVSANNVWAVGYYTVAGVSKTFVEHWNGSSWSQVASPNHGTGGNSLAQISAVPGSSGHDIWAVGGYILLPGGTQRTLTLHYNGTSWSEVSSPNQGTDDNLLTGVAAISSGDVWAVGGYEDANTGYTLAEHWNGSAWTISTALDPGPKGNVFLKVFAAASNSVWAVGYSVDNASMPGALVEHWNGSAWSVSPNTAAGIASYGLDITGGSSGDVWLVGFYAPSLALTAGDVLAEHFNGSAWGQVYTPDPPTSSSALQSVSVVSSTDIWAVGYAEGYMGGTLTFQGVTEHWDGSKWNLVASPHPDPSGDVLSAVEAVSDNDVWAVGYLYNSGVYQTFIMHWNGTHWSQVSSPNPGGNTHGNVLNGIDAASAGDVWAVGYYSSSTIPKTLILHWNGSAWTQSPSADPGAYSNNLQDVAVVPGTGGNDAWAVGHYKNAVGDKYLTLLERWNGTTWSVVFSPSVIGADNNPSDLFAISATDVWAVGTEYIGNSGRNLALHWDGSAWSISNILQQGSSGNELDDVAGTASNDVYVVGSYAGANGAAQTLMEHWNGTTWSIVPSTPSPGFSARLQGMAIVSSTDMWTVGIYGLDGFQDAETLAERYHPCVVSCNITFSDVPVGSTFYPYIHCLACLGIINGYPDGTFKPNANVTRGQLSKIVANSAGFNDPQTIQMFQDVPVGSTFQVYIGRLASRGYINGYPCGGAGETCGPGNLPYFRPNANATRGQISKIDSNAAGFNDAPSGQQFQDVAVGSTYYTYTYRLASRNIMAGYPCGGAGEPCGPGNLPYFRPNNNATRGQTSKIVSGTFFPDCSSSEAAKP